MLRLLTKGEGTMCTCITYKNGDFYLGRNMDIEYSFGEKVVITPRSYPLKFRETEACDSRYAMIGMATVADNYPLYAEAVNEQGLFIAGLNFPGNACYNERQEGMTNVAPYELIPWLLSACGSCEEALRKLENANLTDTPFAENMPLAPLHWILADADGCYVIESVKEGLKIYENPYGVLTNNPTFPYYQMHMANYLNLSSLPPSNRFSAGLDLRAYGQGMGAAGMPGDFSPASRFVKAAFLKWNSDSPQDEMSNIAQVFHILDGVAMVRGSVITPEGKNDITTYSCCINARTGDYYYKTYYNNQIQLVSLNEDSCSGNELKCFALACEQQIKRHN